MQIFLHMLPKFILVHNGPIIHCSMPVFHQLQIQQLHQWVMKISFSLYQLLHEKYLQSLLERMEKQTGDTIREHVVYSRTYSVSNFIQDYHSFKGNAYGLANTLLQTAFLKPALRSKKVSNLVFAGQLTVPGPGVPPSLISGELAAREVSLMLS
jgi:phytoene desaturase